MSILDFFRRDNLADPDKIAQQAIIQINAIHKNGIDTIQAFEGSIAIYDACAKALVFDNVIGDQKLLGVRVPLKKSVMGEAFQHGEPVCGPTKHMDDAHGGPHQVMAFPLVFGQEPIGVMTGVRRANEAKFTSDDMRAFEPFVRFCEDVLTNAVFKLRMANTQGKEPSCRIPQLISRLYRKEFSKNEQKAIQIIIALEKIVEAAPDGLDICLEQVKLMGRVAGQMGGQT